DPSKGGILIRRKRREIGWLVVGSQARGRGAGSCPVLAALEALGPGPVCVRAPRRPRFPRVRHARGRGDRDPARGRVAKARNETSTGRRPR
ncbi:MAG TPA: hypothetical protein DFS52_14265, partial [Myxococcales bacterium]|nr:hypothetical protein [Myxococcales bacterium]